LFFSGIGKLINPRPLFETLQQINILPQVVIVLISTILPIFEIMIGLALFFRIRTDKAIWIALALFLCFFLFSIYGVIAGMKNDCGCFGNIIESKFGITMVIRNFVLFMVSIIVFIKINNVRSK